MQTGGREGDINRENPWTYFMDAPQAQPKMAKVFSVCDRDEVERTIQRRKKKGIA